MMVPEETRIGSFINKNHLRKHFFNEQFSLLLTSYGTDAEFDSGSVYLKRLEPLPVDNNNQAVR